MDWFTRRFIKASLIWLCVGVALGLAMAIHPAWAIYRPAHLHTLLIGFVTMMIYGVAYHVIPRFSGHPLRNRALAGVHLVIANAGLAAMTLGFVLRVSPGRSLLFGSIALGAGGLLSGAGAVIFASNIWRTMDGPPQKRSPAASRAWLPTPRIRDHIV